MGFGILVPEQKSINLDRCKSITFSPRLDVETGGKLVTITAYCAATMSAPGHQRRFARVAEMSVLRRIAHLSQPPLIARGAKRPLGYR